jgi:hypothetical protein
MKGKARAIGGYVILNVLLFVAANGVALFLAVKNYESEQTIDAAAGDSLAVDASAAVVDGSDAGAPSGSMPDGESGVAAAAEPAPAPEAAPAQASIEALVAANELDLEETALGDEERLRQIAKIFVNMKPDEMRPILERLDDETVFRIVMAMKERDAAQVFASLTPSRAAAITRRMAQTASVGANG